MISNGGGRSSSSCIFSSSASAASCSNCSSASPPIWLSSSSPSSASSSSSSSSSSAAAAALRPLLARLPMPRRGVCMTERRDEDCCDLCCRSRDLSLLRDEEEEAAGMGAGCELRTGELLGGGMECVVSGTSCDSCMPCSSSQASLICLKICTTCLMQSSRRVCRWLQAARQTGQSNSPCLRAG